MGLYVASSGSGPDLVLLHGWGSTAAVWNDVAAQLEPKFRLHCVDLPGHGANSKFELLTLDAVTDALAAALSERVIVCGWSLGGQVALNWALRHPRQVARLVLISSTPRFVNGGQWECGLDSAVLDDFARALSDDCAAALRRFAALEAHGGAAARTVLRRLRECTVKHGMHAAAALAAGLRILQNTDLRDRLPLIAQPALIVHGARDAIIPLAAADYLARALPRARLEVFENSAHAPFVTHARRAARCMAEFCDER